MNFLKRLVLNLVLLAIMLVVLYFVMPDVMGAVYQLYYAILGPGLVLLVLIAAAMPNRRR